MLPDESQLASLVFAAQQGDREALESVVGYAQGYIYNLSLRMLQRPMDAEDATQEILIRLITHLGQFRGESSFTTWMYRVASNHLLNMELRDREKYRLSFDDMTLRLDQSLAAYDADGETSVEATVENAQLIEEVKRSCTLGMLMCLDRTERLIVVLSDLLDVSSDEGAAIIGITPAAYRKRLSRARGALVAFVGRQCGIVDPQNPCRCHKHVANKIRVGRLDPAHLDYSQPHDTASLIAAVQAEQPDLDIQNRAAALLRAHPHYTSRIDCTGMINAALNAGDPDS